MVFWKIGGESISDASVGGGLYQIPSGYFWNGSIKQNLNTPFVSLL